MSAIFGLFNLCGKQVAREDIKRMDAAMAQHGADGGGMWTRGFTGLGQRQMCFTPEDRFERQPVISAGGRCALVCDARIDNRPELRDDLNILPSEAIDLPDSLYILRAYEKWGEECVRHLAGVFAFALWDEQRHGLFIARSPIVAPALFYYSTPSVLAFATMPGGLHALPFVPRTLNEKKLADLLVESPAMQEDTLYQAIYRLPTGHSLTVGPGTLKVSRFWRPDLTRDILFHHDEDYAAAFHKQLERVTRDHLRSLTPVSLMMSGGLDSSSVAATSASLLRMRGGRLTAYTEAPRAGFAGPVPAHRYADETPFVRAIAAMYDNIDLNIVRTDGRTFLDDLDSLFLHLEFPFRNTSNLVWIKAILQEARQRDSRVMLDGMQGNLTISSDGSALLPSLLRRGRWIEALRQAGALARRGRARSTFRGLVGQGLMPLLPAPLWLAVGRLRGLPETVSSQPWRSWSAIHPDFAVEQKVGERARDAGYDFRYRNTPHSREIRREALASQDFGVYISAFRAMFGVDWRSPLADVRIAEFSLALPETQYLHDGEPRSLVRRAMAGRLPVEVLSNAKRGLQAADWFERSTSIRGEIAAEVERLKGCELARRALDLERMRGLVENWPCGGWNEMKVIEEYNYVLERGLMVGRFLRWMDESRKIRQRGP